MNKKGFTLIELLAILAILAIILLIAIPSVLNIVEDSKKSAFVSSSLLITKAAEEVFVSSAGHIKEINIDEFRDNLSFSNNYVGNITLLDFGNYNYKYLVTITDTSNNYSLCNIIRDDISVESIKLGECPDYSMNLTHEINPSSWTNSDVMISVSSADNSFEYFKLPESDGSLITNRNTSYSANTNGSYIFKVKNSYSDYERDYVVPIKNIDKSQPTISFDQKLTGVDELTVTVIASDKQSGVREILLPDSTIISGDNATFKITLNGTYTFKAIDNVGNENTRELTITNLDNTPPVLTLTKNPTTWTNSNVVISASSTDEDLNYILLPDNKKGTSYTVSNNGTYTFKAYDTSGNKTTQSIDITNIDKIDPNISYTVSTTEWSKSVVININTSDTLSGVNYIETPTLNKIYSTTTSFTATSNGTYTFKVYDKVGNSKVLNVVISNIDKIAPTITLRPDITATTDNNIVISYSTSDTQSGVKEITLPYNTVASTSNGTYTATRNGTYVFKVIDNVGNVTTQSIEITNIDRPFITKWKTTSTNQTITLPFSSSYTYDITVDWGDGAVETYTTYDVSHTYASAGEYVIKISGTMPFFSSSYNGEIPMIKIIDFGEVNVEALAFGTIFSSYGCKNLTGSIPNPRSYSFEKLEYAPFMFSECTNLTGSIPENLFESATNVTNFSLTFYGASGLTGSIPENLFANNPNVTEFDSTFYGASGLTGSIPENLFKNNPLVTNFWSTFRGASGLTGSIPENLFKNNPLVTSFSSTFEGASGLTGSIPENLFANNPNVTSFHGTFYEASGLTGTIPGNLFANNPNVTDFDETFRGASGLTGTIPGNLFANNPNVTDFDETFRGATGLTGSIPANLFANNPNVTNFWSTFNGASGLTGSIPANLFKNNPLVTSFYSTFEGASGLTGSIPENLFANNPKVTSFRNTFRGASGLTGSIPANLFANNPNVTNFWSTFNGASGLTGSIPANLFANNPNVTDFDETFRGASGLTGNAPELWNTHTKVTNSSRCFYGLTNLTNYSSIPSNWK